MEHSSKTEYQIAIDAGGTMTDTFLVKDTGEWVLGKSLSSLEDEAKAYMESVQDACNNWELKTSDVHPQTISDIYTGTAGVNALLTGAGKKVGLLITMGQEDSPFLDRGLTWLDHHPYDLWKYQLHKHTRPLVEPRNVKPIRERITSGSYFPPGSHLEAGHIVIPIMEQEVVAAVNELLDNDLDVIGICFMNSFINPVHERKAAEIVRRLVKERGLPTKVICSCDICPRQKENARLKTLLVECFAAEVVRKGYGRVETAAVKDGMKHNLRTLLGYGAAVDIRYPRLCESLISGPTGGILGGNALAKVLGLRNVACVDLGGTTFECGMLVDGDLPLTNNSNFSRHRLNMPMIKLDSVGAGTGTVIRVDPKVKRILLGPESAGYRVGVCYKYPDITISDVNLALGTLSADNFLGGKVKLDRDKAIRLLDERLAKPLGMNVFDACYGVLDLQHSMLQEFMSDTIAAKGYDPEEYTMLVYGGSGPLHMWGMEGHVKFKSICTVPWAAAFSAYGAATADYFHHYEKGVNCPFLHELSEDQTLQIASSMNKAWEELEKQAYDELKEEGFAAKDVTLSYGIQARYVGQLFSSWSAPVAKGRVTSLKDVDAICQAFENVYLKTYPHAARHPESGYLITAVYLDAAVPKVKPVVQKYKVGPKQPPKEALKGTRQVYWNRKWTESKIWDMDKLHAGVRVDGPAVIEHSMTTLPIPPGRHVTFDEHRVIWYQGDGK
jgi:N-methylhydantoinase A